MTQIAAQMYTLREQCKTPADIAASCAKLKKMGFGAIQASASGFNEIPAAELKKILDDNGMVCCATHWGLDKLANVDAAVDYHKAIGCELTAIGGFGFGGKPRAEWEAFVQQYNAIAPRLAAKGLRLGYHNHSHELAPLDPDPKKLDPKQVPQQLLIDKLDKSVWFEIDTYWIAHGGADPAAWITKVAQSGPGRIPAIHCKDMTIDGGRNHKMCEVGVGNLNWTAILAAAKAAGVQWYIIERDSGDLDPFESLNISLNNMKAMGLS